MASITRVDAFLDWIQQEVANGGNPTDPTDPNDPTDPQRPQPIPTTQPDPNDPTDPSDPAARPGCQGETYEGRLRGKPRHLVRVR
jgi:hypothetical protein